MFLVIGGLMTVPKVVFPVIRGLVHVVWGRILYRRLNIKDNDAALPDLLTLFSTFLNISSVSEYETLNPDGTCSFEVITSGDKSCWFTNHYKLQCDDPRIDLMGKTAQECLEQGFTHHGWFLNWVNQDPQIMKFLWKSLERAWDTGTKRWVYPWLRLLC